MDIGVSFSSSNVKVSNTTISNNYGSGLTYNNSDGNIVNCYIQYNEAGGGGGVNIDSWSNPSFDNCLIGNNTANNSYGAGGGVYIGDNSCPVFNEVIFVNNSSAYVGGGVAIYDSDAYYDYPNGVEFSSCTFKGNSAGSAGQGRGGALFFRYSTLTINNSTFQN